MEFPSKAVYGPHQTTAALSNWDGRDEYEDVVQIASRDDDGIAYNGEDAGAVEVMHAINIGMSPKSEQWERMNDRSLMPSWSTSQDSKRGDEEPVSPHIDTTLMIDDGKENYTQQSQQVLSTSLAISPSSANSLMMDLSDLENSMNDEVSTVKEWMKRVKSERDRLRREKTKLSQQLAAERQGRSAEVSQLQSEMMDIKTRSQCEVESLTEKLHSTRVKMIEDMAMRDVATKDDMETIQRHLDSYKTKVASLEEALIKEKSTSSLREANKLEELRKEHFAQLSKAIVELEEKFESDFKDMAEQRESSLDEEREAHARTTQELRSTKDEKTYVDKELQERTQELETLKVEHEKCAVLIEEGIASTQEEATSVKAELDKILLERNALKDELATSNIAMEDLAMQLEVTSTELYSLQSQMDESRHNDLQEHDRMKDQLKNMCELVEVTSNDRDAARDDLRESQAQIQLLTKSNEEANSELSNLKEQAHKRQVEIVALNEARKCFELYEKESKIEIRRLQKRLEETTSDILRSVQSEDGSKDASVSNSIASSIKSTNSECSKDSSIKSGANKDLLAVPALAEESSIQTDISVVEETKSVSIARSELHTLHETLACVEKERDLLHDEINQSNRERDELRSMVNALRSGDNDIVNSIASSDAINSNESIDRELADLKSKLDKAEEAYVKAEVERCEQLADLTRERNVLASQVKTLKASLLIKEVDAMSSDNTATREEEVKEAEAAAATAASAKALEELNLIQEKLHTQIKQNERLSQELAAASSFPGAKEELQILQEKVDTQMRVNGGMSVELTLLRDTVARAPSQDLQDRLDDQMRENEKLSEELVALRSSAESAANVENLQDRLDTQLNENKKISSELITLKARLVDSTNVEEKMAKNEEESQLREMFNDKVRENEELSLELATLQEGIEQIQEELCAEVKKHETVSSELIALRATTTNEDQTAIAIQIGKEIDELKAEHRIEIKLLKKEHATIKTKANVLSKEKDKLADAYETERLSNNELEVAIEELVNLLEAERVLHGEKAKEFRVIKKKYSSMRRKRVPVDAAYQACRILLGRLEAMVASMRSEASATPESTDGQEQRSDTGGQDVSSAIKLINSLTQVLDEPAGSESSLASISETFSSDNMQMEELATKCESLEIKVRAVKLKIASFAVENSELKQKVGQLETMAPLAEAEPPAPSSSDVSAQTSLPNRHESDLESLRGENKSLREQSEHLTKELVDSTNAFEETIQGYEAAIAKVKNALSEKKRENGTLKNDLERMATSMAETHQGELGTYVEAVDVLKKKLDEGDAVIKNIETEKIKLRLEVGRLKTDFSEVISQFEGELSRSCEASDAALRTKSDECETANALLRAKEEEYCQEHSRLEAALADAEAEIEGVKSELSKHEIKMNEKEHERQELQKCLGELKAINAKEDKRHQFEVEQLQSKLEGVLMSNNEHIQSVEQRESVITELSTNCDRLLDELSKKDLEKQDLEKVLDRLGVSKTEEIREHQADIQRLQSQLDDAKLSIEDNLQLCDQLHADCTKLKEEKESALEENDVLISKITSLTRAQDQLHIDCTNLKEEKEFALEKIASLAQAQDQLQEENEALKGEKEVALRKNDHLDAKITFLAKAQDQLQEEKETALEKSHALTAKIASQQLDLDRAALTQEHLKKEKATALADNDELTSKIIHNEGKFNQLLTKLEANETEIEGMRSELADCEESERESAQVVVGHERTIDKLRRTVSELELDNGNLRTSVDSIENRLVSVREEAQLAENERQKAILAKEDIREELRKVTSKYNDIVASNQKLDETIGSLREEVKQVEEAKEEVARTAQYEMSKVASRLDDMIANTQKLEEDHEHENSRLKNEMNEQVKSMNEVIQSLKSQVKMVEYDKEENRRMYEKDLHVAVADVEMLKIKHGDAINNLDSLNTLVKNLKAALEGEKENAQILLSQFKKSEKDRKSHVKQKEELEAEIVSRLKSESSMAERIRNLEGLEKEVASRIRSESTMTEMIRNLETELHDLRPRAKAMEEELIEVKTSMMEKENSHNDELTDFKSKINEGTRKYTSLQEESKNMLRKKAEEAAKLRVVLQEARDKLGRLWEENEELKKGDNDSLKSVQQMLNDAIRSRANTDASLQESLQLLEQQKRIDIKRKGEVAQLEQTVEILKSKERYLESYVASLKKQIRRG